MKASFKVISLALSAICASPGIHAHVPNPAQLARFQSALLNKSQPFESTGSVQFQGQSISYALSWFSPETYSVRLARLPGSLYSQGRGSESWTLIRRQTLCLIKTESRVVNCPAPQAWALLELSGIPEAGARGLFTADILDSSEIAYKETDSTIPEDIANRRVMLVMGRQGKTPVTHLEIRGRDTNTSTPGLEFPLVRFDQTFLAPVLIRVKNKGEVLTVTAGSDLEVRRGRTRFTAVLANELFIQSNMQQNLLIRRTDPTPTKNMKFPSTEKSLAQSEAFRDDLSVSGQFLLDSVLLTH